MAGSPLLAARDELTVKAQISKSDFSLSLGEAILFR